MTPAPFSEPINNPWAKGDDQCNKRQRCRRKEREREEDELSRGESEKGVRRMMWVRKMQKVASDESEQEEDE